jgi:hypothetical protein
MVLYGYKMSLSLREEHTMRVFKKKDIYTLERGNNKIVVKSNGEKYIMLKIGGTCFMDWGNDKCIQF